LADCASGAVFDDWSGGLRLCSPSARKNSGSAEARHSSKTNFAPFVEREESISILVGTTQSSGGLETGAALDGSNLTDAQLETFAASGWLIARTGTDSLRHAC